jgi:hypothetical protein
VLQFRGRGCDLRCWALAYRELDDALSPSVIQCDVLAEALNRSRPEIEAPRHPGSELAIAHHFDAKWGFASLSQLQILLWTFVVAASAVYVMSLSGQLIEITNTALVLLGIAGAAGIGAAAHFEAQGATAEAAAAKAAADIIAAEKAAAATAAAAAAPPEPTAAARLTAENKSAEREKAAKAKIAKHTRARADALKNPPAAQIPKWSDLIFNESVKDDGIVTREIDVARFQMLLFTLYRYIPAARTANAPDV